MVTEKRVGERVLFACEACGLHYADAQTAAQCEAWCRAHPGTCDPAISSRSVRVD